MSDVLEGIDPHAVPSGTSPNQHATAHFRETGHFIVTSFEPGEDWFWNYGTGKPFSGPRLALPRSRPLDQPSPGPKGRVPLIGKITSINEHPVYDDGNMPRA